MNISYGKLPRSVSVETPKSVDNCTDDNNVSARMKTLHENVGQHYVTGANPVISEQLARAGTRLAMLLNISGVPRRASINGAPTGPLQVLGHVRRDL